MSPYVLSHCLKLPFHVFLLCIKVCTYFIWKCNIIFQTYCVDWYVNTELNSEIDDKSVPVSYFCTEWHCYIFEVNRRNVYLGDNIDLWPCYSLTVTLCEGFLSIPTEKRHLISAPGASFALVLEMAKSLSHLFISYNELHPGFPLNKPASEIALFISLKRCCNCVPPQLI